MLKHLYSHLYDAVMNILFLFRRSAAFAELLDRFGASLGEDVLDAGCGSGWISRRLSAAVGPTGTVLGIDPSATAISYARYKAAPHEQYRAGTLEKLPVPNASQDRVITSLVLHHVPKESRSTAFQELRRALRDDGTLMVIEIRHPRTKANKLLFGWQSCVKNSLTPDDLRRLATDSGLVNIQTGNHWRWLQWLTAKTPSDTAPAPR